jgi:hypothetical protein
MKVGGAAGGIASCCRRRAGRRPSYQLGAGAQSSQAPACTAARRTAAAGPARAASQSQRRLYYSVFPSRPGYRWDHQAVEAACRAAAAAGPIAAAACSMQQPAWNDLLLLDSIHAALARSDSEFPSVAHSTQQQLAPHANFLGRQPAQNPEM